MEFKQSSKEGEILNKVIVTGGTGFIGSNVVAALLNAGFQVGILCRETSSLKLIEDLLDKITIFKASHSLEGIIHAFNDFKPDCVIHLASLFIAEHKSHEVHDLIDANIKYPSLILEAMKECNINKFINTGTSWQHFNNEAYNPVCLYAATKEAFEKIIDYYVYALNFKCISLTIFDSYGENDPRKKLINLLKEFSLRKEILSMSKGQQKIDLTHVKDIAAGFVNAYEYLDAIKYGEHKKYALCTGRVLSLKEVIKIFEENTGLKLNILWGEKAYRYREVMEPWNNYEILPNWQSTISLEEGVKSLVK